MVNSQSERPLLDARNLQRQGHGAEAVEMFRAALAENPGNGEVWYELGYLLKAEARYEEALDAFGQALANGISRAEEVHLSRGVIYADNLRRDDEAEQELHAALAIDPDYVPALLNMGNLHEERGEREQALQSYDRLLRGPKSRNPEHNELRYEALARSAQLRPAAGIDDPLLEHLRVAAGTQSNKTVRANLLFALGHSYDRLGAYDLAFDAFAKANRWLLRQSGRTYDRIQASSLTDALIAAFPATIAPDPDQADSQVAQPLFICGMYRSGSTLIEQVLAAHPQVTAGGELDWLRRVAAVRLAPFPQSVAVPNPVRDVALADEYRAHLANLFPDGMHGAYITDKRPDNFILIGLIKRLFPRARIVHTVRDPLDNGLSVYANHLHTKVAGYACDLGDIGHYFGEYRRLMAHWKSLYPDSILDFDYDMFVLDPKPALERLLQFLGLPWDDRCLAFHRQGSTVKTASYWQIRQPLHRNASGRWRNYAAHLEPMRAALVEGGLLEAGNR